MYSVMHPSLVTSGNVANASASVMRSARLELENATRPCETNMSAACICTIKRLPCARAQSASLRQSACPRQSAILRQPTAHDSPQSVAHGMGSPAGRARRQPAPHRTVGTLVSSAAEAETRRQR